MKISDRSHFYFPKLVFVFIFACTTGRAQERLSAGATFPAVIVFGDSIMDTGNNNNLRTAIKCNFPPYGRDFPGGIPTGRFSDGKVPSDLIAEMLGIKSIVPAYLSPNLTPKDLLTGVTFASGGSGYDPLSASLVRVLSLSDQLNYFKEYISKLKEVAGEDKADFILARSLFIIVASSNDIATTYLVRKPHYDVPSYAEFLADAASSFITEIYGLGARRIAVFSAVPVGCVPAQRTVRGGLTRACVEATNVLAQQFNVKLSPKLDSLSKNLPNSRIVLVDVYNHLLDIIQKPQNYGLQVADRGCCGTGLIEAIFLCSKLTQGTCPNPSSYVFWDSYHPTERTYRIIVKELIDKYIHRFD